MHLVEDSILVEFIATSDEEVINISEEYMQNLRDSLIYSKLVSDDARLYKDFSLAYLEHYTIYDSIWKIVIKLSSYEKGFELEVSISSESYNISLEDDRLERLKVAVKKFIKTKHKKVFWLYDTESEFLASELYPKVFNVENLTRKFITMVMNRKFGSQWWDLVSSKLQNKHNSRTSSYKTFISNFQDVDDCLMSIDTGDLHKILSYKLKTWEYSEKNIKKLSDYKLNPEKFRDIFRSQQVVKIDFWKEVFCQFLDENFLENFLTFEENRNHIAHNKLIDRKAFKKILNSIDIVEEALVCGIKNVSSEMKSREALKEEELLILHEDFIESQRMTVESQLMDEIQKDELESIIIGDTQILELFNKKLEQLYYSIKEEYRFIDSLDFSAYTNILGNSNSGRVFTIDNEVAGKLLIFEAYTEIDYSEGSKSYLHLGYRIGESSNYKNLGAVLFINGEVACDELQSSFIPIRHAFFNELDLNDLRKRIEDVINTMIDDK